MKRKLIAGILCLYFMMVSLCGSSYQVNAGVEKKVTITARKCNITVKQGEKENFEFEYDTKKFKVKVSGENQKVIRIDRKSGTEELLMDRVTVKLPKKFGYDRLYLNGDMAGIQICKLRVPMSIKLKKSSVSLSVEKGMAKDINCTMDHSSGSFHFAKDSDYTLHLVKKASSCAMDSHFKGDTTAEKKIYVSGKGTTKVTVNATACALSFHYGDK